MNKWIAILIVNLLCLPIVFSQSAYITAGVGIQPNSVETPYQCGACEFFAPWPLSTATAEWTQSKMNLGYHFYLGLSKELEFKNQWFLRGGFQINHVINRLTEEGDNREYKPNIPQGTVISSFTSNSKASYSNSEISFAIGKTINLFKKESKIFLGGYARIRIQDWIKSDESFTQFYTGIQTETIYNEALERYFEVIISKTELDSPITNEYSNDWDADFNQDLDYGLFAGITFPVLSLKNSAFSGQLLVSQDLNKNKPHNAFYGLGPFFKRTSISIGLVYQPAQMQVPHPRKPEKKRGLSNGVYAGVSIFSFGAFSLNGSWVSSKNIGIDWSGRLYVYEDQGSVYYGLNYRLGKSRFFLKGGMEYLWAPNSEGFSEKTALFSAGGRCIIPFSKWLGLQLDAGYLFKRELREVHGGFPTFEIGFVLMPKGEK